MDGQPVDPSKWNQKDPFIPILTENVNGKWKEIDRNKILNKPNPNWRIFGRSTSDDKGPPMMLVNALETLNKLNIQPKFNIKLIIDFQEEMGSPTIVDAVSKFKEKLKSDYLLIIDGPRHPSNKPTLTFGLALKELNIDHNFVSRKKRKNVFSYEELLDIKIFSNYKLIINTTPLGMYPKINLLPNIPYRLITKNYYLYDLVYNPETTRFLEKGKRKGAKIKNGLEMLHLQAELSWNYWNQK